MAAKKSGNPSSTETIVAVAAVVFIFSLIGVLNWSSDVGALVQVAQPDSGSDDGATAQTADDAASGGLTETVSTVEEAAPAPSGTTLSSGSSGFLVNDGPGVSR